MRERALTGACQRRVQACKASAGTDETSSSSVMSVGRVQPQSTAANNNKAPRIDFFMIFSNESRIG